MMMEKCNVKICRLCLSMIKDENYEILEEMRAEMLETVLINNVKLFVSSDPIICCNCTQSLQKCYDFKTNCLNNQFIKSVKTFINVNEPLKVNLQVKKPLEDGKMHKGQKMCRLCFSLDSHYYANVSDDFGDGSIQNMLMRCIPELDLDLTNEPLVCQACLYLLKRQLTFTQHCLELEEKINLFREQKTKSNHDTVDLYDVHLFFERLKTENDSDRNIPILVNDPNPPPEAAFIKTESDCENAEHDISDNVEMKIIEAALIKTEPVCENAELDISENVEMKTIEAALIKNEPDCKIWEDAEIDISENVEMKIIEAAVIKNEPDCENAELDISENMEMKVEHNNGENGDSDREEENRNLRKQDQEKSNTLKEQSSSKLDITNSDKKFSCSQCSYITKYKWSLKRHYMIHTSPSEIKMFRCTICGHESKRRAHLKSHMIIHKDPSELKMYMCTICSYQSRRKMNLKEHMYTHTKERFKCQYCPFESKNLHNVTKHSAIHKEKQIFRCSRCTYTSKYKKLCVKHSENHENSSKRHKFQCNLCEYATHSEGKLKSHLVVHKDIPENEMFTCYTCNLKFKWKSNLTSHMLTHNNPSEVVYKCEQCSYVTRIKRYFQYHLKRHKDLFIDDYKCEKCDYSTKRPRNLYRHIKRIH